jgi:hypothetical protein
MAETPQAPILAAHEKKELVRMAKVSFRESEGEQAGDAMG